MGKAIDLLYDAMTSQITRSQVKCSIFDKEKEFVFISNMGNDVYSIPLVNSGTWSNDYITNVNRWLESKNGENDINPIGYCCVECNRQLEATSFLMVYRYIMKYDSENLLYKWSKDGKTYYIGKNMILDGNKRILMMKGVSPSAKSVINIDIGCVMNDDYMSKTILNEFVPAYVRAFNANVIIKDMSDFSTSKDEYEMKYMDCKLINNALNAKLHELSEASFV